MWLIFRIRLWALAIDIALALLSYEAAIVAFAWLHDHALELHTRSFDWGPLLALIAIVGTFFYMGLYKLEIWVSRPLHLATLFKAVLVALIVTCFFVFTFKAPFVDYSRFTTFLAFGLFFLLTGFVRIGLVDRLYRADVRNRRGPTIVIGDSTDSGILVSRLKELRGYSRTLVLQPHDRSRNGNPAESHLITAIETAEPAPRQVFIDGASAGYRACIDLVRAARLRGADAYVTGRLVSALDTTKLLMRLFELPVMRARSNPILQDSAGESISKRSFDIVISAVALILLAPVFAAVAVAIKIDSPGPVFFRQRRVGLNGTTFRLLKFRSMRTGSAAADHQGYVCSLIQNGEVACVDENGVEVYKLPEDARVTRVGHFLRKYSLDELPQFWNVLTGDMSVVGPRPALEYEVAAYREWHRLRLQVTPGVSGLWQVSGRSRVSFDQMVFQDVMYGCNQSLLTDVYICYRTLPAVLIGRGAL
ncbi:MAG TPA: exopolysaccharide biosynthesis polyprenyl glycosylphosphotransferase [Thermoleophilia bacterium]|nr:exopolysaccharide biosynthesis polyprenyl glycosylphosphotransferase [Thermoleophilia bacterium]